MKITVNYPTVRLLAEFKLNCHSVDKLLCSFISTYKNICTLASLC